MGSLNNVKSVGVYCRRPLFALVRLVVLCLVADFKLTSGSKCTPIALGNGSGSDDHAPAVGCLAVVVLRHEASLICRSAHRIVMPFVCWYSVAFLLCAMWI